ncbi:MAG: PAS domain-containing protein [Myxococcales bacterium]|nr:PAS domain-containing protein [Myxococcales bacterium]MDD9966314.1 PAS domain-containing protein [Myxococcales bacterium]
MSRGPHEEDPLSNWLSGKGLETLEAITAEAPDILGVMDRDLRIRYLNRTGPAMTRAEALGKSVVELVPPRYRGTARAAYTKVLTTGIGLCFETMYSDGRETRIWEVRVGPIRCEGEIIGLVGLTTNVTEQRRASVDRDRFFALSLDVLVAATPDGRFKRANPAFGEALGYDVDAVVGKPFIDFVHPDDHERTLEAFRTVIQGEPVSDFENRYRRSDGEYRVLSWRAQVDPVTGDGYAVGRDITQQRAAEAQLRRAQKLEAVGQLAGGVAHDFNNLLLAILANAELAAGAAEGEPEVTRHLREIERAGRRAADLTKQLLAFSRQQTLHATVADLNAQIDSLMNMLRRLLPANIGIELLPGDDLAPVRADPTQLEQVILNLCVNARDAMEVGGQLTIRTDNVAVEASDANLPPWARPGPYVRMSVSDTGVGMSDEVREHAFEPFFTTKGAQRGAGLGLSTVYGIVQQHEGMVRVHSEPDRGTTFEVFLPAVAGFAAADGEQVAGSSEGGRETILVAEDEELVRQPMVKMLESAGYRTIAAGDGLEAIRRLSEYPEPIHLALLDVVMPKLGGPQAWERIRDLRPGLRVLFMSGYADTSNLERLPPDADVLQKPFRKGELLHRIRSTLDA